MLILNLDLPLLGLRSSTLPLVPRGSIAYFVLVLKPFHFDQSLFQHLLVFEISNLQNNLKIMELKKNATFLTSCAVLLIVFVAVVQSAPNNSTTPATANSTNKTTPTVTNATSASGNKTSGGSSDEECEPEPEPVTSKNATKTSGDRQGKQLTPGDQDKYIHDRTNANTTTAAPGDAAKLQGNSSTTTTTLAPAAGTATTFSPSSRWANVIVATLVASFTYSAL